MSEGAGRFNANADINFPLYKGHMATADGVLAVLWRRFKYYKDINFRHLYRVEDDDLRLSHQLVGYQLGRGSGRETGAR